jgi:DNA polymerase-1
MNIQNLPRGDMTVKELFCPKQDALVFADWSQIEPRLTAYFMGRMGDTKLAEFIKTEGDAYMATAVGVYGKPADEVTKEERQTCKMVFLSLLYGAGNRRLSQSLGVSMAEASRIRDEFYGAWPEVPALLDGILRTYRRRGYIRTPWGRRLHPHADHAAINHLVQGSAADLMKQALVRAHKRLTMDGLLDSHIVATVHDEIIFDAGTEELPALTKEIIPQAVNDESINEIVPIVVDIEVSSTNWAEKVPLEEWNVRESQQAAA